MSTMRRLAWVILGASVGLSVAGLAFSAANEGFNLDLIAFALSFFSVQIVGAILLSHRPDNSIGWIMSGLGLFVALQIFAEGYAPPDREFPAGGLVLTWMVAHAYLFIFFSIAMLFFLFPTGSVTHPRWRLITRAMVMGLVISVVSLYTRPGPLDDESGNGAVNPYAIDAGFLDVMGVVGAVMLLGGVALSVVALIIRFRKSSGVTRLQMKWFAGASAIFAAVLTVNLVLRNFFTLPAAVDIVLSLVFALIPLSLGNAILRYRLYEIDVFINRALVYGALSAMVVLLYISFVFALQLVLDPITADSDFAVAASTLAVAALFQPLRSRTQAFIDKRFYRRKYDSAQALAGFGARTRDEVDLDALQQDIVSVVRTTIQPAHVALWLNQEPVR
jgi:hypothetical protein